MDDDVPEHEYAHLANAVYDIRQLKVPEHNNSPNSSAVSYFSSNTEPDLDTGASSRHESHDGGDPDDSIIEAQGFDSIYTLVSLEGFNAGSC